MAEDALDREIDANFDFFRRVVSSHMPVHAGEYALIRHQHIVSFHSEVADADRAARSAFADGLYSIQEVRERPIDLGFFSHAGR